MDKHSDGRWKMEDGRWNLRLNHFFSEKKQFSRFIKIILIKLQLCISIGITSIHWTSVFIVIIVDFI